MSDKITNEISTLSINEKPLKPPKPPKPKREGLDGESATKESVTINTDIAAIPPPQEQQENSEKGNANIKEHSNLSGTIWSAVKLFPSSLSIGSGFMPSSPVISFKDIKNIGHFLKMNREGIFEKNVYLITPDSLVYFKPSIVLDNIDGAKLIDQFDLPSDYHHNILSLQLTTVELLDDTEIPAIEDRSSVFKILSKKKSFYARQCTSEKNNELFTLIQKACKEAQVTPITAEHTAPVWMPPTDPDCQICHYPFSFLSRRHHCRNCGKCVCEVCSKDRVRIPRLDPYQLFKVCSPCSVELKENMKYGH